MSYVKTTCPYCGVGCGVSVDAESNSVLGSNSHPANFGRLCSKGSALGETINPEFTPQRLTKPMVSGEEVSWDLATQLIADKIQNSIREHGKDSVAFYLSGQLLTEDYYVANKLMKGFIGTANVDTNSRLCMASAVAAYKRAFGSDTVPCTYQDLDNADLIVLIGSNAAWTHPVLYQRMVAAKEQNPNLKVVLIDPRKTATAEFADLHLQIKPSSDGFLFQGLLNFLSDTDSLDHDYIAQATEGFESAQQSVAYLTLRATAEKTGVQEHDLSTFFSWFADTKKTVSFYSQGINQSATGTDKCNAIINCHLATGKIGYAGAGPFSITGQPNAMGGREVGGLSNTLAAHMGFSSAETERVRRFWKAPTIANREGLKAVDMFHALHVGKIKVIWIMGTNPAVSLPNSNKVREALANCDTVIVSDVTHTDTSNFADIILPALAWGEKDGTVTNSERRISRQRAFQKAQGTAKSDWWALSQVGKKLGFIEQFEYQSSHDIFVEHAALSGLENHGTRDFDISALQNLSAEQYQHLKPIQWPVTKERPNGTERMFADAKFFTPSIKAQFVISQSTLAKAHQEQRQNKKTLLLNSGRLRDQWHTMTRTGSAPSLASHRDIAQLEIHPSDAFNIGLSNGSFVRMSNQFGNNVMQLQLSDSAPKGTAFAPIHWSQQFATHSVVNALMPERVDKVSGQPELKATCISIEEFKARSWARIVSAAPIETTDDLAYWSHHKFAKGYVTVVAYDQQIDWQKRIGLAEQKCNVSSFSNPITETESLLLSCESSIDLIVFKAAHPQDLPSSLWLQNLYQQTDLKEIGIALRGELGGDDSLVCACFSTGKKAIETIQKSGVKTLAELSRKLGCGSKCGSCKPELRNLLDTNSDNTKVVQCNPDLH